MSDAFIGEIRLVGFTFEPNGWMFCHGQIMPIVENTALFSLIGTTYGGDGVTTYGLPDLRDRAPVHLGGGLNLGQFGGERGHVLTVQESNHAHAVRASANQASTGNPAAMVLAAKRRGGVNVYAPQPAVFLDPSTISTHAGGGAPHENRQPFVGMHFIICVEGIYPSRN
jgi:microcystin-dependent protein